MENAIIMDAFEFLGFHLTKKMLELGYEVTGVSYFARSEIDMEEMESEIGRNGNFTKSGIDSFPDTVFKTDALILSLYDFYITGKDPFLKKEFLSAPIKPSSVILLLPLQMAGAAGGTEGMERLHRISEQVSTMSDHVLKVFLPTVFGPFQPESFEFQKAMSGLKNQAAAGSFRELKRDALFCRDAAGTIAELMESEKWGDYILQSESGRNWLECAKALDLPEPGEDVDDARFSQGIPMITVKQQISNKAGLAEQKRRLFL